MARIDDDDLDYENSENELDDELDDELKDELNDDLDLDCSDEQKRQLDEELAALLAGADDESPPPSQKSSGPIENSDDGAGCVSVPEPQSKTPSQDACDERNQLNGEPLVLPAEAVEQCQLSSHPKSPGSIENLDDGAVCISLPESQSPHDSVPGEDDCDDTDIFAQLMEMEVDKDDIDPDLGDGGGVETDSKCPIKENRETEPPTSLKPTVPHEISTSKRQKPQPNDSLKTVSDGREVVPEDLPCRDQQQLLNKLKRKLDECLRPQDQVDQKICIVELTPPDRAYWELCQEFKSKHPELFSERPQPWETPSVSSELDEVDKERVNLNSSADSVDNNTNEKHDPDLDVWQVESDDEESENFKRRQKSRAEKAKSQADEARSRAELALLKSKQEDGAKSKQPNILESLAQYVKDHPIIEKVNNMLGKNLLPDAFEFFCNEVDVKREWFQDYAQEVLKKLSYELLMKKHYVMLDKVIQRLESIHTQDEKFWEMIIWAAKGQLDACNSPNDRRYAPVSRPLMHMIGGFSIII